MRPVVVDANRRLGLIRVARMLPAVEERCGRILDQEIVRRSDTHVAQLEQSFRTMSTRAAILTMGS